MYLSVTTCCPLANVGLINSWTSCAREAAMRRASVLSARGDIGFRSIDRSDSPTGVPPGSLVNAALIFAATRSACVVFPLASPPSKAINLAFTFRTLLCLFFWVVNKYVAD